MKQLFNIASLNGSLHKIAYSNFERIKSNLKMNSEKNPLKSREIYFR